MSWTDDPVRDYDAWVRKEEQKMDKLYTCECCGYKITSDYLYKIGDERYCPECADRLFKVSNITI